MYTPFSQKTNRRLAWALIIIGFLLSSPPFIPSPDDFINLFLGSHVANALGVDFMTGVIITYFAGIPLIVAGILIYPYNTRRFANGLWHRSMRMGRNMFRCFPVIGIPVPIFLIAAVLSFLFMWYLGSLYFTHLSQSVEDLIAQMLGVV